MTYDDSTERCKHTNGPKSDCEHCKNAKPSQKGRMLLYQCACEKPWKIRVAAKRRQPHLICIDCDTELMPVTDRPSDDESF